MKLLSHDCRNLVAFSLATGLACLAEAQAPTPVNDLTNGQKADADKVMENFRQALNNAHAASESANAAQTTVDNLQSEVNPLLGLLSVNGTLVSSSGSFGAAEYLYVTNRGPNAEPASMYMEGFQNYLQLVARPEATNVVGSGIRFLTGDTSGQALARMIILPSGVVRVEKGIIAPLGSPGVGNSFATGYAFVGSVDSGLFCPQAGQVGLYNAGSLTMRVTSTGTTLERGGFTLLGTGTLSSPKFGIDAGGYVGIGATPGTDARLIIGSNAPLGSTPAGIYFNYTGPSFLTWGGAPTNISIRCANNIVTQESFLSVSDSRTKRIEGRSQSAQDLLTLQNIEVTDYTFVDTVRKGNGRQKKVVAQQVEKVYPQAVSKTTDVVPDIFKTAAYRDGWVHLATTLQVGQRVRLLDDKQEGMFEVREVRGEAFRTDFVPAGERVFVYGREVDDLRVVDYEALSMLNLSATQEIVRRLTALEKESKVLQAENEVLRAKVAQVESLAADVAQLKSALEPLRAK